LRKRGDCHEDGSLHLLERFIEKRRKLKRNKGWKKAVSRCRLLFSSVLLRLKSLAQRDDLCGSSTWYILAGIPAALYLSVFTCGEKAYIAKQKKRHG
jgi:hypothetical protein